MEKESKKIEHLTRPNYLKEAENENKEKDMIAAINRMGDKMPKKDIEKMKKSYGIK